MNFNLDDEFRDRNRRHTPQERKNLESLIEKEKCAPGALTVAVIGAARLLCDGYTTLSICQEKGIATTAPVEIAFANRQDVLEWIDLRQRARRNLTKEEMAERRAERVPRVVEAIAEGKSIKSIAKEEGVSPKTIRDDLDDSDGGGDRSPRNSTDSATTGAGESKVPLCRPCRMSAKGPKPGCRDCAQMRSRPPVRPKKAEPLVRCDRCTRHKRTEDYCETCPQCQARRGKSKPAPQAPDFDDPSDDQDDPPKGKRGATVSIGEGFDVKFEKLYGSMVLLIEERKVAMGSDKFHKACAEHLLQCRRNYMSWASA